MSWYDWIDSEYNTDGYFIDQIGSEDLAVFNEDHIIVCSDALMRHPVGPSDIILNNSEYYSAQSGGTSN